jgi:hypothetical protein
MNEDEARTVLRDHLQAYRRRTHGELASLVGRSEAVELRGASGVVYQLEVQVVWDERPGGAVRVLGAIDDGGWRAFMPLCEDFIAPADGR